MRGNLEREAGGGRGVALEKGVRRYRPIISSTFRPELTPQSGQDFGGFRRSYTKQTGGRATHTTVPEEIGARFKVERKVPYPRTLSEIIL